MAKRGFPFKAFTGEVRHGESAWPIRFSIATSAKGELRFLVRPIPYSAQTVGLRRAWDTPGQVVPYFSLRGRSADGVEFHSDHVVIAGIRHDTTPTRSDLKPRLHCAKGVFRSEPDDRSSRPYLRYALRGFEAYPHLEAECRLGSVRMAGDYPEPRTERISGLLQIVPRDAPADFAAWRSEAEALCLHIQRYMSFAQAKLIRAPVQTVWDGEVYEQVVLSQNGRVRSTQAVVHPLTSQAFFEKVVAAYFDPPVDAKAITFALEWFAMEAGYTETRLINAMTAIENLANSNLPDNITAFLPAASFEDLAKVMRRAARDHLAKLDAEEVDPCAVAAFLEALPGKMRDLNRRPLKAKIALLAHTWGAQVSDLMDGDGLARAVRARDRIVHRGSYYDPAESSAERRDLWDHVLLMREFVIRLVLTSLAYEGIYISFRGGQHDVRFPPPGETDGRATAQAPALGDLIPPPSLE